MFKSPPGRLAPLLLALSIRLIAQSGNTAKMSEPFGKVPVFFEENQGQASRDVAFIARGPSLLALIGQGRMLLSAEGRAFSIQIAHANVGARSETEAQIEGVSNYYLGSRAIGGLRHFAAVRVRNVRPGIDIRYYSHGPSIEYDLIIHRDGDASALRLRFDGPGGIKLTGAGDIGLDTDRGAVVQKKPYAWQEVGGKRKQIACHYALSANNEVQLILGPYSHSADLIVDPVISYSTLLGGSGSDLADSIAVDSTGHAYVTGWTRSADFPVTTGKLHGSSDAFVTELNPEGTGLIYSTYIGGSADDQASSIAIDASGSAYITGYTTSSDFPFTNGHFVAGSDAFVVKLGSAGTVEYAVGLTGSGTDMGSGIAVDATGDAYVAGATSSSDFPVTQGVYSTKLLGSSSAFAAKITPSGQIAYATYLGGSNHDGAAAIAIDSNGDAFLGGSTNSSDFPVTMGAYSTTYRGQNDAFVTELNPDGTALLFSTFLGGTSPDYVSGLAADATGCYVTGTTLSGDFPITPGAFLTSKPSQAQAYVSGFVAKLDPTGASLLFSTFLGGSNHDYPYGIAVKDGSAYVVGEALSANFPTTTGALKMRLSGVTYSDSDMFLSKLSADGSSLVYSTLYGATGYSGSENALGVALDGVGGVYMVGFVITPAAAKYLFPVTPGAFQGPPTGLSTTEESAGIVKIDFSSSTLCTPSVSPQSQNLPGYGGAISFLLTLAPGCPWEAIADQFVNLTIPFISLNTPLFGLGSNSPIEITGVVPQNNSTASGLTGSVRIGSATFTVNQSAGSCSAPLVNPSSVMFDPSGGPTTFTLSLPSQCAWTAISSAPWLNVVTNLSGTGSGSVTIFAGVNSFSQRSATLTLAGVAIPVTQTGSGCSASVAGMPLSFSGQGGTGFAGIVTASSCNWTAYSEASWIQVSPASVNGIGTGGAPFIVAANPSLAPRTGFILIADQTLTITQGAGPYGYISGYLLATVAGGGSSSMPANGDGGPASQAYFHTIRRLAWDSATTTLYVVDNQNSGTRIRAITSDGNINTIAGGGAGTGENIAATSASLGNASFVAVDQSSSLYVSDTAGRVRRISQGLISTFAGGNSTGFSGDGSSATSALLNYPEGLGTDSSGNLYIADLYNNRVREVSDGIITTFAGGGTSGLGDGGPAVSASLSSPYGVTFDLAGNLYIADTGNNRVRKVSHGIISTIAGGGTAGDGGPATSAQLSGPEDVAVDTLGDVFIIENSYNRIRMVTPQGIIGTISPYGATPSGLATDAAGDLYYGDNGANAEVKVLIPLTGFCSYSVLPSVSVPSKGASLSLAVVAAPGCNWSATSLSPWITISSGTSGSANGNVQITVSSNLLAPSRTGAIAIAGQTVVVTQATPGDINGDGFTDLAWLNNSNSLVAAWYLGGAQGNTYQSWAWLNSGPLQGWTLKGMADFNGDGHPDLIWKNNGTGQLAVWYMGGPQGDTYESWAWLSTTSMTGWTFVGAADFNRDGRPDLIWQNKKTGQVAVWYMGGPGGNIYQSWDWLAAANMQGWTAIGATDFNEDGHADLIWQNNSTRQVAVWYMGGATGNTYQSWDWLGAENMAGWTVIGAADLNGDGHPDLLWQNSSTQQVAVWYLGGTNGNAYQSWAWVDPVGQTGWTALSTF